VETGPNDPILSRRLVWGLPPLVLGAGASLGWGWMTGTLLHRWPQTGSSALLATLILLAPPTPWGPIHGLRWACFGMCWIPMMLADLGLVSVLVMAPILLGVSLFAHPAPGDRL
jgi:hypothetical protein